MSGSVIRVGAEAVVYRVGWIGLDLVCKHRVPKPYRIPELDKKIREQRTIHEVKVMLTLKRAHVPCPAVILVNLIDAEIYMQYIEGVELRDWLSKANIESVVKIARELGRIVGRMHLSKIAHGDLTTSNIIIDREDKMYLVDFGLSIFTEDIEDIAVDIHLLDRSLQSIHHNIHETFMENFLQGYADITGKDFTEKIKRKIREIRMRGRYVEERRRCVS